MPASILEHQTTLLDSSDTQKEGAELFADGKLLGKFNKMVVGKDTGGRLPIDLYEGTLDLTNIKKISVIDPLVECHLVLKTYSISLPDFKIESWKAGELNGNMLRIESISGSWAN